MTRSLALCLVAGSLAAYGCGDGGGPGEEVEFPERDYVCVGDPPPPHEPCETTEEAHTADERTAPAPDGEETTYTFVVSTLSLPEAMDGEAAGFNLDGLDSSEGSSAGDANCEEFNPDFISLSDPDHVGVDNALQGLLGTIEGFLDPADCPMMNTRGCLDALLQEQINDGGVILLMEVSGVNDLQFDSSVSLQFVLGELPGGSGTACMDDMECTVSGERCVSGACATAPMLDAGDMIAPGQTFATAMELAVVDGDIFEGRLRATAPSLLLMISTSDFDIPLMITNPEVRFDISDGELTNGAIGGYVLNDDIVEAAATIGGIDEGTVRPVIESVADILPMSANPMICDALSLGVTFGAVGAVRTP